MKTLSVVLPVLLCSSHFDKQGTSIENRNKVLYVVQELSGHLAAEITRLCSLAKQDDLPLTQGMDIYEMEVSR